MLFNSVSFLIFFPIVLVLYFYLPKNLRWIMLLAASYIFYMFWEPKYIVLIVFVTLVNYIAGLLIAGTKNSGAKRFWLVAGLALSLGLLVVFKYASFFNESVRALFSWLGIGYPVKQFSLVLPMGISFFTFQSLSYTIDVYRGKQAPEKHFGYFALYVSYFPQLVAGPIERSERLLPQLKKDFVFDYDRAVQGLQRMLYGFFLKIFIADNIAGCVNVVYDNPSAFSGLALIGATLLFAVQIFCDFAGYSNIAIGSARVMGIDLMENFRQPYFATSIKDFWHRWHISLSSWFGDYVFIPLGGSRVKPLRKYFNIMLVFLLSGLWHGAAWTFVLWGFLHGALRVVEEILSKPRKALESRLSGKGRTAYNLVSGIFVFVFVCFAWIFFRANNVADAFYIVQNLFRDAGQWTQFAYLNAVRASMLMRFKSVLLPLVFGLGVMLFVWIRREKKKGIHAMVKAWPGWLRWSMYFTVSFLIVIMFIMGNSEAQFIYFQF